MRTIKTELYTFNELSKQAKIQAIELCREKLYEFNDFNTWVIDDCYLLEPKEPEKKLLNLKENLIIKNTRKLYFSLDRNKYIDISSAMDIQNHFEFLTWLGLTKNIIENVHYTIKKDSIGFSLLENYIDFLPKEINLLKQAKVKFSNHCIDILNSISESLDYCFSDEFIIEEINVNEYEFLISGEQY